MGGGGRQGGSLLWLIPSLPSHNQNHAFNEMGMLNIGFSRHKLLWKKLLMLLLLPALAGSHSEGGGGGSEY